MNDLDVVVAKRDSKRFVFVNRRVIGEIRDGYFIQRVTQKHLFRELNSKGIEHDVYQRLLHEPVSIWRLEFMDTKQILDIPLAMIPECGIFEPPHSAGSQYHVKLRFFNVAHPALQKGLL